MSIGKSLDAEISNRLLFVVSHAMPLGIAIAIVDRLGGGVPSDLQNVINEAAADAFR